MDSELVFTELSVDPGSVIRPQTITVSTYKDLLQTTGSLKRI